MSSIVLELQKELLNSNCDVLSVLRKAHLIALKLNLTEFDEWIKSELNGYHNVNCIPDYRLAYGELKAFNPHKGWIPVIIPDSKIERMICCQKFNNSISELKQLCNDSRTDYLICNFSGEMQKKYFGNPSYLYAIHVSVSKVKSIIDSVKNCLLEWTLKLESEGVLGEDMIFNQEETLSAQSIPQNVYNYYGMVISGDIKDSQIANDNASINIVKNKGVNMSDFEKIAKSITDNICCLDNENKKTVLDSIEMLKEELNKPEPKTKYISNGIKLLAPIMTIANGFPALASNIKKLIDFLTLYINNI